MCTLQGSSMRDISCTWTHSPSVGRYDPRRECTTVVSNQLPSCCCQQYHPPRQTSRLRAYCWCRCCFGGLLTGIKTLDMLPAGTDGRKACESIGIHSPDGEYLPLLVPVVTEGRPEEWLNRVEEAMFATTKKHLYKVLEESKGWQGGCCNIA